MPRLSASADAAAAVNTGLPSSGPGRRESFVGSSLASLFGAASNATTDVSPQTETEVSASSSDLSPGSTASRVPFAVTAAVPEPVSKPSEPEQPQLATAAPLFEHFLVVGATRDVRPSIIHSFIRIYRTSVLMLHAYVFLSGRLLMSLLIRFSNRSQIPSAIGSGNASAVCSHHPVPRHLHPLVLLLVVVH